MKSGVLSRKAKRILSKRDCGPRVVLHSLPYLASHSSEGKAESSGCLGARVARARGRSIVSVLSHCYRPSGAIAPSATVGDLSCKIMNRRRRCPRCRSTAALAARKSEELGFGPLARPSKRTARLLLSVNLEHRPIAVRATADRCSIERRNIAVTFRRSI